jgi:hypothetical protein
VTATTTSQNVHVTPMRFYVGSEALLRSGVKTVKNSWFHLAGLPDEIAQLLQEIGEPAAEASAEDAG